MTTNRMGLIPEQAANTFTDEQLESLAYGNNPQSNVYRELLAHRKASKGKTELHMGDAIDAFKSLKLEVIKQYSENAHLGAMGSTNVDVWTSKLGGVLEYRQSNGGCSLVIYAPIQAVEVPVEMTPEMMRAVQLNSELGAYAASNLCGAYSLFDEFWRVACRAAMLKSVTNEP